MKIWDEVLRAPLVSVSFESREGVMWGRVLAVGEEWGILRMVQNTGELGPIVLFQIEDVEDIALDWRAKESLVEVMDAIDETVTAPDSYLKKLVHTKSVVSLKLYGEDSSTLAQLESLDGEWIQWREFTSQGIERVRTLVPIERLRSVETDGPLERTLASRLAQLDLE